jgi:hypothetical protein
MKLSELQQLFARDTVALFKFIHDSGYSFTYGEAMRSPEQAAIYAKEGKGIIDSLHCQRLAIDLNIFNEKGEYLDKSEDYEIFARYWESLSPCNRNGINFKRADANHFERNDKPTK